MFYLKYFILYSFLGFIYESSLFKISKINKHSGVLNGPYTLVYGIGGVICQYFLKFFNNPFITFFIFQFITTLVELITGYLIHYFYHFNSWDYSYKKWHFGKYICLEYSIIWGLMATVFVKYLNNFWNNIILLIPNSFFITIFIIIAIDIFITKRK